MSKEYKDQDWEKVLSKLTEENAETRPHPATAYIGLVSFVVVTALSALAVMRINSTVNRAWEDMEVFRPGIGFVDAFVITGLVWFLFLLKVSISEAVGRSNDKR
tara:strand:+ start:439 stop:750 length:312 start_codon:yes stop_codon:yes gene_type:complete